MNPGAPCLCWLSCHLCRSRLGSTLSYQRGRSPAVSQRDCCDLVRKDKKHVAEPILSQKFDNGLVLLGEPIHTAESAAFTIRVPAGSAYEPSNRNGLSAVTCELSQLGS